MEVNSINRYAALWVLLILPLIALEPSWANDGEAEEAAPPTVITAPAPEHSPATTHMPAIYLRPGQRYPLEGFVPERARLEPLSVAEAKQTTEGTVLVGKSPGQATLFMEAGGKKLEIPVIVRGQAGQATGPSAKQSGALDLRALPGIRITSLGPKTVVHGEILSRSAYQRVLFYLKHYPAQILMLALPAPGVRASLLEQAHTMLAERGLSNVRITSAGNRYFLEGWVSAPEDVDHALEAAQAVLPNIENRLPVPIRVDPTISVRVFLLEISRHAHQALGLAWPASIQQALLLSPQTALFSPSWTASLRHLSQNGQAKVLAEPILAVKSGASAELSAGGEIPIRVTGRHENKVVWKHYGLKIRLHIAGVAGKSIRTKLESESSQLDDATAVDGVPGIKTNRMSTEIDATAGQPVLLTGLFQTSASKDVEKFPLLGSIPILGELFKSRRFREHESELLVALLPDFGAEPARVPFVSGRRLGFDGSWGVFD